MARPDSARIPTADELADLLAGSRPPDDAVELAAVQQALRQNLLARSSEPLRLDRYEIRRFLGAGGHGSVYEAFDPKLERRVAIKILRAGGRSESEKTTAPLDPLHVERHGARILHEARSIAKLSDPRVVAVYDVAECPLEFLEASGQGSRHSLFMVMEYVEGRTLREWQEQEKPPPEVVLEVFLEAARGLSAAHQARVVHGDFKPENVLVTTDRQVKILDFGIARVVGGSFGVGVFAGTRRYASPEQLEGLPLDERSDQYSFCVALHEALSGIRPKVRLPADADSGARTIAASEALLSRLEGVLRRGLREVPSARHRSMQALVRALGLAAHGSPGRSNIAAALVGVLLALVPVVPDAVPAAQGLDTDCVQARQGAVWNGERARRLEQAFLSTRLPYAGDSWKSVSSELERYVARLRETAVAICSLPGGGALPAHATSRPELFCLTEHTRALASLLDAIETRPKEMLPQVVDAVFSLRAPEQCLTVRADSDPGSLALPTCADAIRGELYALEAVLTAGTGFVEGRSKSAAVLQEGRGCAPRALAPWAELVYGLYLLRDRELVLAARAFRQAFLGAELSGDARTSIRAMTAEIVAHDSRGGEHELVDRLIEDATARVRQGGDALGPDLRASFLDEVSRVRRHQARYADAVELALEAVRLREEHWGKEHPLTHGSRKRLADAYYRQRDFQKAESIALEVLRNALAHVGPRHPDVADAQTLLGNIAWRRGAYARAEKYFAENELIWTELFGTESELTRYAIKAQADVLISARDHAAAWAKLEPLLASLRAAQDTSRLTAVVEESAASALTGLGRYKEAEELLDAAAAGAARIKGADHVDLAYPLLARGRLELARGNPTLAEEHCRAAVHHWRRLGERFPKLSWAYACVGLALLESGDNQKAQEALELALSLFSSDADDASNLAEIEFALARSVEHSDPVRARALAKQAAERYLDSPRHRNAASPVLAWMEQKARSRARGAP